MKTLSWLLILGISTFMHLGDCFIYVLAGKGGTLFT